MFIKTIYAIDDDFVWFLRFFMMLFDFCQKCSSKSNLFLF